MTCTQHSSVEVYVVRISGVICNQEPHCAYGNRENSGGSAVHPLAAINVLTELIQVSTSFENVEGYYAH